MKKRIALLMAGILAASSLAGCAAADSGKEKIRLMVWSPSNDQSKDSGEWLQTSCENFAKLHPEWDITFVYGVADEASAATQVAQDPTASADVFFYANNALTTLTDSKAGAKFGGKYAEEIRSTNTEEMLKSVTWEGELYGAPYTSNLWYMYYDKSVFSEEDIKSLDTMLEKGVVSFPFTNSWYLPAFYVGNGCTLFGEDGMDEDAGVEFGGENAVEVTDYLIDLYQHPNFKVDADGSGIAGLRDGSINAMFSGSWDAAAIEEILGDNMGVAALPTFNLNGKEVQMEAYAGSKAVGVNAYSKHMVQAVELAIYLASAEAQRLHYELLNVVPCNTELLKDETIASNPVVFAQNDTFSRTSILQPIVSKMNNCWVPVENLGKGIRNGSVTHENAKQMTQDMNTAMNSDGI